MIRMLIHFIKHKTSLGEHYGALIQMLLSPRFHLCMILFAYITNAILLDGG